MNNCRNNKTVAAFLRFMHPKDVNMLEGSIMKGMFSLMMPVMIMHVCQNLFNIVDMTVLKEFSSDKNAVGAVGACSTLISLITVLLIGVATGGNVVVAKYLGAQDKENAKKAIGNSVLIGFVGGIVMLIFGCVFAEPLLIMQNCDESLLPEAVLYFRLYFCSVPFLMLYNFSASILQALGDSRKPMYFLLISGVAKLIFTLFFTAGLHAGVEGVAVATIISNLIAGVLTTMAIVRHGDGVCLKFRYLKFYKTETAKIFKIGAPTGIQRGLYAIANVAIMAVVNAKGPDATTGVSIANNFDAILYNISIAASIAALPYIAQNIGAKNMKRAKEAIVKGLLLTILMGASFGALSAIFSPQLSSIMTDSPEAIRFSCEKMVIISSTYFICGISELFFSAMRAMGRPMIPTVVAFLYMFALRYAWVYLIYPFLPNNFTYLYLVWPVSWILCIVTTLIFFFPRLKQLTAELSDSSTSLQPTLK